VVFHGAVSVRVSGVGRRHRTSVSPRGTDYLEVLFHLECIRKEADRLAAAQDDGTRSRDILQRLALEIDAARHAVRPYFKR
jgi:hypothetical protein